MPTGYTARLCDGEQTFKDFAMLCARACGALIEMREDPMDAPIPEKIKRSSYYDEALSKAVAEYDRLKTSVDCACLSTMFMTSATLTLNKAIKFHPTSTALSKCLTTRSNMQFKTSKPPADTSTKPARK